MRVISVVLLCCAALMAASNTNLPQLPPHQVVARVNGVELYGNALNDYVQAVLPDFSFHGKVQPQKLQDYRRAALDRMVLHELIYQEGLRRHITVPKAKVDAEIALMQGRFRFPEGFQLALSRRGLTLQELRAHIQRSLVIAAVVRHDVTARAVVTDQEARTYYEKNLPRFREPATVHICEILIPAGPDATKQANEVRAQAAAKNTDEQFWQLASRYSKDDYRVMGGDRGWVHRGRLEPELEQPAFALRSGQLSAPIETKRGIYLLRAQGKRAGRLVTFAEVRNTIRNQLLDGKRQQLRDALRTRVSKNSKIELLAQF